MPTPMMKCGHAANATDANGRPCCAIHAGLTEDAYIVVEGPSLEGRLAKCGICKKSVPSNTNLAFFEHCPDKEFDRFYCGCRGWD